MPRHSWSVASVGVGIGAWALSFIGLPLFVAWLALGLAVFLVIADVLTWVAKRGSRSAGRTRAQSSHPPTGGSGNGAGAVAGDPLVRVDYTDQTANPLVVRFDFPNAPVNRQGEIELVAGHGTRVDWLVELTNAAEGAERGFITILAPRHLIHHIEPVSTFLQTKTDFTVENMVSDGIDSLRFRGWFSPLAGGGRTTELEFKTTISFAHRDIPIRVQVDDVLGSRGLADAYLPIRAVIAPDGKPVRGR